MTHLTQIYSLFTDVWFATRPLQKVGGANGIIFDKSKNWKWNSTSPTTWVWLEIPAEGSVQKATSCVPCFWVIPNYRWHSSFCEERAAYGQVLSGRLREHVEFILRLWANLRAPPRRDRPWRGRRVKFEQYVPASPVNFHSGEFAYFGSIPFSKSQQNVPF